MVLVEKLDNEGEDVDEGNQNDFVDVAEGANNPDADADEEGSSNSWAELMGKDIQLKVRTSIPTSWNKNGN